MALNSILFLVPEDRPATDAADMPTFFTDLNLDQIVDSVTAGRAAYNLRPFFYTPVGSVAAVNYRHEVLTDLEGQALAECVRVFAHGMHRVRDHFEQANKLRYRYQKEIWLLEAAQVYCDAVSGLARDLTSLDLGSAGFQAFRGYVDRYVRSADFASSAIDARTLKAKLSDVRYCVHIKGLRVKVSNYDGEADYSADVEATFEKFKQGAVKDYRVNFMTYAEMDHVEANILESVAKLHPELFSAIDSFYDVHRNFLDDTIRDFDREVQFYLAYLDYLTPLKAAGLRFCYPTVSEQSKDVLARETFDLALAGKLVADDSSVIRNDFYLKDHERIFVVSGANQGGKTTFARTFGQLHYLALLGCPVPGSEAHLFRYDQLFTHFEKEEDLSDLSGKLHDDLIRIHAILEQATARSIVILNEIFTSTTLSDALLLGTSVLERIAELDALCVCVTFVDELASLTESTVSMVSTVAPDKPAARTYKVIREPANGLSYAVAIAEKYGLTYQSLKRRLAS